MNLNTPGIYRFLNKYNEVIYIGKAKNLQNRLNQHEKISHLSKECYSQVRKIEVAPLKSESDALLYEQYYINTYKPKYNKKDKATDRLNIKLNELNWKNYKKFKNGIQNLNDINDSNKKLGIFGSICKAICLIFYYSLKIAFLICYYIFKGIFILIKKIFR